jgi:hypothetical protein
VHSYLHIGTGEVLRVVDGIADPEMHSRIASDATYMRIEPVSSREQYRWMERFIPMVETPDLRERLERAIDGKGAFRRFKDVLMSYAPERERWFAFRSERLRVFMEAWLGAHALQPIARTAWAPEPAAAAAAAAPPKEAQPISQDQLTGRRGRSADALRKQLHELADTLGARDLEKVMAFAEFVKARRAARSYALRHGGPEGEEGDSAPPPVAGVAPEGAVHAPSTADDDDEESSPSSRKRTAAR